MTIDCHAGISYDRIVLISAIVVSGSIVKILIVS